MGGGVKADRPALKMAYSKQKLMDLETTKVTADISRNILKSRGEDNGWRGRGQGRSAGGAHRREGMLNWR